MTIGLVHKSWLSAGTLEASAIALLFLHTNSGYLLFQFLLLHAAASACASLAVWCLLPANYRQPRQLVFALLFSLSFFIPLLGVAGFLLGVLWAHLMPQIQQDSPFASTNNPRFEAPRANSRTSRFRTGQWRSQLEEATTPLDLRVQAMIAIHAVSARNATHTLRSMLTDAEEDLRLLAYGMLESQESAIMEAIHQALSRLDSSKNDDTRYHQHKLLAELYWELIYQNLVLSDMRQHSLKQVKQHAQAALQLQFGCPDCHLLLARACVQLDELDSAEEAYNMTLALGVPSQRIEPYLAELAFMQRRYPEVRKRMTRFRHKNSALQLTPLTDFWSLS